jgi:CHAT domain-containing protein
VTGAAGNSYLRMAGGEELTARTILESRNVADIDVVTLSACTTGVAQGGYDEAFSLTTAFLVARARTVFGSLWPVPDGATSVLAFMIHHHLRRDGDAPAVALHRAQLWMLDPDRKCPDEMPAELRERAERVDGADIGSWAGFVHHGR